MKDLTKREAMEILLAGGKVNYWSKRSKWTKGQYSPLRWCELTGVVGCYGERFTLDYAKLTEHEDTCEDLQ